MTIADAGEPQLTFDLVADVQQLLQFHFMRSALEAGTIAAVVAGAVGYFMVLRGQSFAGHALAQVGFPGAAGAVLVGAAPGAGLLVFCVGAALGIGTLGDGVGVERRRESAAIGSILGFTLALGFLFATLYQGFIGGVTALLFGTFLGVTEGQVVLLVVVGTIILGALGLIARPLLFASVDPQTAAARGVPVRALNLVFLVLLGATAAVVAQITGTLLVFALLVAPAATAQELAQRPAVCVALSVGIALLVVWAGLAAAYYSPYPVGFFVTTFGFATFVAARVARQVGRMRWRRWVVATA